MERKRIRLLHTSDVHIGSDLYPRDARQGFENVLDTVRHLSVDALLIAGDLFDSGTVPEDSVHYVFESLAGLHRPVLVLPGNHDTLMTSDSFLLHESRENVHILRDPVGEMVHFSDLTLSVWGCPVYHHVPEFHPLGDIQPRPDGGWYVAIGHGIVLDSVSFIDRGSPITHEELANADCDYIALGHTHVFRDVTKGKASAFYSGAPSGGQERTAALVTLDPDLGVSVERIHVS